MKASKRIVIKIHRWNGAKSFKKGQVLKVTLVKIGRIANGGEYPTVIQFQVLPK
jgi:hypothetical protein